MGNLEYLFAAYTIVWVALFLYLLHLDRRSRRVEQDLDELRQMLDEGRK